MPVSSRRTHELKTLLRQMLLGWLALALGISHVTQSQLQVFPASVFWRAFPATPQEVLFARFGSSAAVGDFNCDGLGDVAIGAPWDDVTVLVSMIPVVRAAAGSVTIVFGTTEGSGFTSQRLTQSSFSGIAAVESSAHFGWSLAAGDFDGNGCVDLAIGAPDDDLPGVVDAGTVIVGWGSTSGIVSGVLIHQDVPTVEDVAEEGDRFGFSLASGNLDFDGDDDLVVGVPFEDVSGFENAGLIQIFFGSPSTAGLVLGDRTFDQDSLNVPGLADTNNNFGWALAIGLHQQSMKASIFISVPRSPVGNQTEAGMVVRITDPAEAFNYGVQAFSQGSTGIPGVEEAFDHFGLALAAGDFDGDGATDFAVGVPGEDLAGSRGLLSSAGAVNIIYAQPIGFSDQVWKQSDLPPFSSESDDTFGDALVTGDFNGDGIDDLAIAASGEQFGSGGIGAGIVHVLYGSSEAGLTNSGHQGLSLGTPSFGDRFGQALAAGPVNFGNSDDLVIGVPGFDNTVQDAGIALVYESTMLFSAALFSDDFEAGNLDAWSDQTP